MNDFLVKLQEQLGYHFSNQTLLVQSLTHRSFGALNNERLEFLGDAILDLMIGEAFYHRYPAASEGDLSHMRAQAVCGESLAAVGRELNMGSCLRLGAGEANSGGRDRQSSLANAVEAVVAAVYLDGGMDACHRVVETLFAEVINQFAPDQRKDAKTRLQEYLQGKHFDLPHYQLVARAGKDHEASFTVMCEIAGMNLRAQAEATSRKRAEQLAAEKIIAQLGLP